MVRYTAIDLGGIRVADEASFLEQLTFRPDWADTINTITIPSGLDPGGGVFLIPPDVVGNLPAGQFTIEWTWGTAGGGARQTFELQGYVVTRVVEAIAADNSPFLVTVEDSRRLYRQSATVKRYNVPDSISGDEYFAPTLNAGNPWTWQEVVDDLLTEIPYLTAFALEDEPSYTPENLIFDGVTAWQALGEICELTGHKIGYDPILGTVGAFRVNTTQPGLTATVLALSHHRRANAQARPFCTAKEVRVFFPWRPGEGNTWTPQEPYHLDIPTGITGASEGHVVRWSPRFAERDPTEDIQTALPVNAGALATEANRIAERYIEESASAADPDYFEFAGLHAFAVGQELDAVKFASRGGLTTTAIYYWGGQDPASGSERRYPKHGNPLSNSGWVGKPDAVIPRRVADVPGDADVPLYRRDFAAGTLEAVQDSGLAQVHVPVCNASGEPFPEEQEYLTLLRDWQANWWAVDMLHHLLVNLDDCLLRSQSQGDATRVDNGDPIQFANDFNLDGMEDSLALLQWINGEWQILHVAERKARWVTATYDGGNWTLVAHFEGEDPTPCGFTAECLFDCTCLKPSDHVAGFYDPNTDKYKMVASPSALLGTPDDYTVVKTIGFSQCKAIVASTNFKAFACGAEDDDPAIIDMGFIDVPVMAGTAPTIRDKYGQKSLCWDVTTIKSCGYSAGGSVCIDVIDDCPPDTPGY